MSDRHKDKLPMRSGLLSWSEFLEQTSVHPSELYEVIELGWISPIEPGGDTYLFRVRDVYRLRKMRRLCADFELSSVGGTIIVDLLERIDQLQLKVREMERLLGD